MKPFTSRTALLVRDDIDTDQIIPARFLKGTVKTGLGVHLFNDWRLELPRAQILIAGHNFGCGSSREHAVWALVDKGFRAIIARSFADIFRANATKNGLLPIALAEPEWTRCAKPDLELHVDLDAVTLPDGTRFPYALDGFAKHCLASGLDELGYILSLEERISAYEQNRD